MNPISRWKSFLTTLHLTVPASQKLTPAYASASTSDEFERVLREWKAIELATAGLSTSGR